MPAIGSVTPDTLVSKAGKSALFPVTGLAIAADHTIADRKYYGYNTATILKRGALWAGDTVSQDELTIHEPGCTFFYNGDHNLVAFHTSDDATVVNSFPSYYLPWGYDSAHYAQLGAAANYFTTAALQGCSIYVTGNPASPWVCHLNANAVVPHGAVSSATAKINWMDARFDDVCTTRGIGQINTRSATMNHYMPDTVLDTLTQNQGASGAFKAFWKVTEEELMQFGTVFGVRKSGAWAFYYQKRTRQSYEYKTWFSGRVAYASWTAECVKFWPP